jgi:hypothetical protein
MRLPKTCSNKARENVEEIVSALLNEAATALRWAEQPEVMRRRHDSRVFRERAATALLAVKHLEEAM